MGICQFLHFVVDSVKTLCFSLLQRTTLILLPTSFLHLLLVLDLKVIHHRKVLCLPLCWCCYLCFSPWGFGWC